MWKNKVMSYLVSQGINLYKPSKPMTEDERKLEAKAKFFILNHLCPELGLLVND